MAGGKCLWPAAGGKGEISERDEPVAAIRRRHPGGAGAVSRKKGLSRTLVPACIRQEGPASDGRPLHVS
jgi:hypothetical protein